MSRRGWVLFIAMGLIWGTPYLLIKVSVEWLSPFVVVFGRVALAAAILLPIAAATGNLRGLHRYWRGILAFAVVELSIPFIALTWAEERLSSSVTALVIACVPLVAAIFGRILRPDDRLTPIRLAGLAIGIGGVAALVGLDIQVGTVTALAALVFTVLGYAIGPFIVDGPLKGVPSLGVIAVAMTINAIIYAPFTVATWPTTPVPTQAWLSVVVLGAVCTALAFIIFFALIKEVGASRTTVITFVNPAVALVLGVLILSEPITAGLAIGFPLVILGSILATRKAPVVEVEPHA
ncbi:MAG: DMT family transporter [Actinomycetales bacterium]|nr:DMT family transporter [Actinomycetales bacterium]